MHARVPTLLPAMLASVATDLAQLRCADLTPDGPARRWLEDVGLRPVADRRAADLVVCDATDLAQALERCAGDGLILARSPRGSSVEAVTGNGLMAMGLVRTSSVRDTDAQWELLTRRDAAEVPESRATPAASVVVVTRDEARALLRLLTILAVDDGASPWELIVVDRSSFDATAALLRAVDGDLQVIAAPRQLPRAEAFALGCSRARGELLVGIDVAYVPATDFVQAVVQASRQRTEPRSFTGPLLDGPSGRALNPEAVGRLDAPAARPELFALHRGDFDAAAWRGDAAGMQAALAKLGPAAVVSRFRARRPGPTSPASACSAR